MKIPIHVSISQQLLADLDRWRGKKTRSSVITMGVKRVLEESEGVIIDELTTAQIGAMFHSRVCGCWDLAGCATFAIVNLLIRDKESS